MEDETKIAGDPPEARKERRRDDRGASLVEYALLLALIALVCLSALAMLGGQVGGKKGHGLEHSGSCVSAAMMGGTPGC